MPELPKIGDVVDGLEVIGLNWTYDPDSMTPVSDDIVTAWLWTEDRVHSVDYNAITGERISDGTV